MKKTLIDIRREEEVCNLVNRGGAVGGKGDHIPWRLVKLTNVCLKILR